MSFNNSKVRSIVSTLELPLIIKRLLLALRIRAFTAFLARNCILEKERGLTSLVSLKSTSSKIVSDLDTLVQLQHLEPALPQDYLQ